MTVSADRAAVVQAIAACGVVGIIRLKDPAKLRAVVEAMAAGGVNVLEITMTVPGAVELIRQTAAALPAGCVLGAGTVLDAETTARVIDAGARFIVSPVFRPAIIDAAHAHGAAVLPGCLSPTEILEAWDRGADAIKVFPATALGPTYLRDLHGPLPEIKLIPTGGVSIENARDWIRAGAMAVGVGSALLDPRALAAGDFEQISRNARRIATEVRSARGES
jgi:2-dehydro-3-deoxyphosphogluconate aldolase/(4S)-4-hydroxy-2-oxoglutarate aldolase